MNLQINKTYTFNSLAPSILGTTFKNVTVIGIIDYQTATNYIVPDAMHANIYPHLPVGTPSDPTKYTYYLIRSENGSKTVLAEPWIDADSIVVSSSEVIKITINNVSQSDVSKIRNTLTLMGYSDFTLDLM